MRRSSGGSWTAAARRGAPLVAACWLALAGAAPAAGSAPDPAPASRPIFCPVCGARNLGGSRFCMKDGTPLTPIDPGRFDPGFVRALETYSAEEAQGAVALASRSVVRVRVKTSAVLQYPSTNPSGTAGWLESVVSEGEIVGSGFAVGGTGEIVTNAHVASPFGTPAELTIETQAGKALPASVVGMDRASDLALLKVPLGSPEPLAWGDSTALRLGDETWAIGFPLDIGLSVTRGTVSSIGRMRTGFNQVESYLHSDAYITHGNSGGPLVDVLGRVVGVSDMGFHEEKGQGYSIPSQMARYVSERLARSGKYERGFLGIQVRPIDAEGIQKYGLKRSAGIMVESVLPGAPAHTAGFMAGDVIFGINGRQVPNSYLLQEAVSSVGPGAALKLTIERAGQVREIALTTALRPDEPRIDPILELEKQLNVHFQEDPKRKGPTIRMDDPYSPARRYGLEDGVRVKGVVPARDWPKESSAGDKVKPVPVTTIEEFRQALSGMHLGGRVGVAFHLDRDVHSDVWVAFDETWAIVL